MPVNRCVMCGEIIPEGRQVCLNCEEKIMKEDKSLTECELEEQQADVKERKGV